MKQKLAGKSILNNSSGMITAEFIFSMTLVAGLCMVLFALNFTLSMAEVAQYIAFSAARAHAAGHITPENQVQLAQKKYAELKGNPVLAPIFGAGGTGWFRLSEQLEVRSAGASGATFSDYPSASEDRVPQVGVRFEFTPRILNMKVAFLGSTTEDGPAPSAKITGLLIREPTQQECWELEMKEVRRDAILNLDSRFQELGAAKISEYVPMEDNGC